MGLAKGAPMTLLGSQPLHHAARRPFGLTQAQVRSLQASLLRWFNCHGRRFRWRNQSASKYEVIISEMLLQRTKAETVARFLPAFLQRFPGWRHIAKASKAELEDYLKPIGLWRRRAASMRALARDVVRRRGRFPCSRAALEGLPGVGQYVASAVLLFSHGQPHPLLDGGMARVLERCFGPRRLVDIRHYADLQHMAMMLIDGNDPKKLNWAMLDLAAIVCTPAQPQCQSCPLAHKCLSARLDRAERGGRSRT